MATAARAYNQTYLAPPIIIIIMAATSTANTSVAMEDWVAVSQADIWMHESKLCLYYNLKERSLAARGCKNSCQRLSLARELSSGALGFRDWTSCSRDTPMRGHRIRLDL